MGSITEPCYIQDHAAMNCVIKRLICLFDFWFNVPVNIWLCRDSQLTTLFLGRLCYKEVDLFV